MLWPFEFLERLRCSISSVPIYYAPESKTRVKSYAHFNFSRASVVQFRASRNLYGWIGHPSEKLWPFEFLESFRFSISSVTIYYAPNRTSEWKVMTICISRELPLFNFEHLGILCALIRHPSEKLLPFEFLESIRCSISRVSIYFDPKLDIRVKSYENLNFSRASVVQFRASWNIMRMNQTPEWKVMLPLFNFERLDILCAWIEHPSQKLWKFELLESFCCSISSVLKYYAPESDIRVKSYDHLNFSIASVVQFWASRYIMRMNRISNSKVLTILNFSRASVVQFRASWNLMQLNRTSEWKVMTVWISRELPLFNFERLDKLFARIGHPSEKLSPFEFLERFRCSISSVSI